MAAKKKRRRKPGYCITPTERAMLGRVLEKAVIFGDFHKDEYVVAKRLLKRLGLWQD